MIQLNQLVCGQFMQQLSSSSLVCFSFSQSPPSLLSSPRFSVSCLCNPALQPQCRFSVQARARSFPCNSFNSEAGTRVPFSEETSAAFCQLVPACLTGWHVPYILLFQAFRIRKIRPLAISDKGTKGIWLVDNPLAAGRGIFSSFILQQQFL